MNLPGVMSFDVVPHMPRLVMMVEKLFMCIGKVSNFIFSIFVIYLIFITFFIDYQGRQLKMLKSDPLRPDGCKLFVLLIFLCVQYKLTLFLFTTRVSNPK